MEAECAVCFRCFHRSVVSVSVGKGGNCVWPWRRACSSLPWTTHVRRQTNDVQSDVCVVDGWLPRPAVHALPRAVDGWSGQFPYSTIMFYSPWFVRLKCVLYRMYGKVFGDVYRVDSNIIMGRQKMIKSLSIHCPPGDFLERLVLRTVTDLKEIRRRKSWKLMTIAKWLFVS